MIPDCRDCRDTGDCPHCPNLYGGCEHCEFTGDCPCVLVGWDYRDWPEGDPGEGVEVAAVEESPLQALLGAAIEKGR
jgi:hypothetical protein